MFSARRAAVFSCILSRWGYTNGQMNDHVQLIRDYLLSIYPAEEWPTLLAQAEEWSETRPLSGLKVLDATPLYHNTLGKFMALMAAGAEVWVPARPALPADDTVYPLLSRFGIRTASSRDTAFDIILDCSGQCSRLTPTLGFCELTRSGVQRYEHAQRPVFLVDSSRIKRIETILGTGESFFRALRQLGMQDVAGRRLLVVGYGKVGRGIVHYARQESMRITVADIEDKRGELPGEVDFVPVQDMEAFNDALLHSWCAVTVTGRISALRRRLHATAIIDSPVLLANMGVEDEYGSEIPEERVLNHKKPLNFILKDPTSMRFIETTMALHNACGLELLTQDLPHHPLLPPQDVEEKLLHIVETRGRLGEELAALERDFC